MSGTDSNYRKEKLVSESSGEPAIVATTGQDKIEQENQRGSLIKAVGRAFSLRKNLHALFVRPSGHVAIFDGLRGLMMMIILTFHCFTQYAYSHPALNMQVVYDEMGMLWAWLFHAEYAVDMFFTLSGFLITTILLRQINRIGYIDKRNFYLRRFLRLTPVYYVVLIIYWVGGGPNTENIWANFLYLTNFLDYQDQAMTWSWSLAVEEQFYLIFPLFLGVLMKRSSRPLLWMWALFFASFAIRFVIIMTDDILRTTPASHLLSDMEFHAHRTSLIYDDFHNRFGVILIGCIAAYYQLYYTSDVSEFFNKTSGKIFGWFALLLVAFFFLFPIMDSRFDDAAILQILFETVRYNAVGFGFAVLILVSTEKTLLARLLDKVLGGRFWYPLGQLTYGMYLFHMLVIAVVAPTVASIVSKHPEQYAYSIMEIGLFIAAVSFVLTTLLAIITHLLIERPVMNMRR